MYFEFSLELKESSTASYHKEIQKMYKIIKEIDSIALIIRYQPEEDEKGEISEKNDTGVGVIAKDTLLTFSKAIPYYL